ncbi:MAG TPA: radical SAM family heme chaperone HemW [Patescibacteria group bacterium]|nr:radical SAM family heme chaperone HemW [Patescibacteria group bacterium]
MKEVGLYIHIPFCKQKCSYCDFNSYVCNESQVQSYMDALIKEIKMYNKQQSFQFKTVFLGGGTPTFIHYKHIEAIMREIEPYIAEGAEVSMECNPGTVNHESLKAYRGMGINRLSIGLQAWQSKLQKTLGRIHDTEQFLVNLEQAKQVGFENLSADLMFALPGQSLAMWLETVESVASLGLKHISCYSLKVEEGTPFYKLYQDNKLQLPEDELDRAMYHGAIDLLSKHGFKQYEISNFAVQGYACKHNLIYWENQEYIGVGAGSHSKLDGVRFSNFKSLQAYIGQIEQKTFPIEEKNIISMDEDMWETVILSLRLNKGLDLKHFNHKYKVDFLDQYKAAVSKLIKNGLMIMEDNHVKLTKLGMDLSNSVFIEFLN